jgi:adenylate kinase
MIIILGTPGAGKTTQARLLAKHLGCKCFSMGELIRSQVTGQDRKDMLAGKIIDDKVTLGIIDKSLESMDLNNEECIFEGNPRSVPQAQWWLEQVDKGRFKIKAVVHLTADPEIAENRLDKRGRLDDHDDNVVDTRFAEYHKSIAPTLNYLKEHGVSVHEVDANGTIEEEFQLILKTLDI